ncbi:MULTISPECIES: TetR/AcrR family transcriptional regulator [Streptomyces]|uniref:TetR family transcriptional regulator n=2 Tax=Streptomyces violaceusniger group TaxID=2839105 RepID=A0ABD5JKY9_9ACTN|nr:MULTISPECIES: TetR family transcriptional regulator [Streptomyces]MEE4588426.1 TetR family transcriptional regulator [Streptomyces sp. DSM 41602]WJD97759.1 TetR family transcriptional regulator [Streptomyces antimycoticus]WTA83444.1 TetR family transcriptional regulator [Streptomyces antimycoticus]WTB06077.1 TetR family transcriptional regulator [Streptomyces antimycoticus]
MTTMQGTPKRPRRAPTPEERKQCPERSRRLLMEAARDVFSEKGFAGARVQDIADRAGLNKQLIAYYFGGKEGLYQELTREWLAREATFNDPAVPFEELIVRYLREAFDDPRAIRLAVWRGLTGEEAADERPEDLSDIRRRQAAGELADDLDPAAVLLMCYAVVSAPATMPHAVRQIFGIDPGSQEFQERWEEQLRRIVRHLAA